MLLAIGLLLTYGACVSLSVLYDPRSATVFTTSSARQRGTADEYFGP